MSTFDVVVVGGGPAGASVAGLLARRGAHVALFERGSYHRPRIGESLGGEIRSLLREVGAWDAVRDLLAAAVPFRAVRDAWGGSDLVERSSIAHPLGEGAHVDRRRFDEALAGWARASGAEVRTSSGTVRVGRDEGGVFVTAGGVEHRTRLVIDASGRGAPATAPLGGRRWMACDRQVALYTRAEPRGAAGFDLLLEPAEDGFWYSAPQPDGSLVLVLVTDADLVAAGGRASLPARFSDALSRAPHTTARVRSLVSEAGVGVVRADSGRLCPAFGDDWLAVGDAAMSSDPLAGNGVARALRSALAAADHVVRRLDGAASRDDARARERFAAYLERRAAFYRSESRFPKALFWRRRRTPPIESTNVWLSPEAHLAPCGLDAAATRVASATAESLLPPRAITRLVDALAEPTPAHRALSFLRGAAELDDLRLLAGLQELVAAGVLSATR